MVFYVFEYTRYAFRLVGRIVFSFVLCVIECCNNNSNNTYYCGLAFRDKLFVNPNSVILFTLRTKPNVPGIITVTMLRAETATKR